MADDSGGGNVIIPIDKNGSGKKKPETILDAVSKIQQFYVLESSGRGISKDFLTIKGSLNFFNIGVKTGLTEGLMFIFLTLLFVPVLYDPTILHNLLKHIPGRGPIAFKVMIYFINLAPILMSVGICSYLSKYHIGSITKHAINSLLYGRILLLVIKLVIVFFLFNIIANFLTPSFANKAANFIAPHNQSLYNTIYNIIEILHFKLPELAVETAIVFMIAIAVPFFVIFAASIVKKRRIKKNMNKQRKTGFSLSDIGKTKDGVVLGMGYKLGHPEKLMKLNLSDKNRTGHTFCFGSTRIGKTRLIESMISQDIENGNSVVLFDPKGDIDILEKIVQVTLESNRAEDLFFVNPIYSSLSNKIDPLSHYFMPEEIVNHVVSGIKAKEEFFINVAYETTLAIVMSLIEIQKDDNKKLIEAKKLKPEDVKPISLSFDDIRKKITLEELKTLASDLNDNKTARAQETLVTLQQIVKSPQDYFAKVSSSLRTVLTAMSTGSTGDIMGAVHANKFIERLNTGKGVILVVQTGSMLTRKTASIISRVLISMLQSFTGRLYASGKVLNNPLAIYMDEASSLMYLGIEDLFSKAGGANVMIHAFTQSISDLEAEIGKPFAKKILDNTNTKIFMRVNDSDTAKYVSDYSGKEKRFSSILSLGGGITVREVEEPLVVADDLTTLQKREFYLFTYEGKFKGFTSTSTPLKYHINLPQTGQMNKIKQRETDKTKIAVSLEAISQLWLDTNKELAEKWTKIYNTIADKIKRKHKVKKKKLISAITIPVVILIIVPLAITALAVLFINVHSTGILSLYTQLYLREMLAFGYELLSSAKRLFNEYLFTSIITALILAAIYMMLKIVSLNKKKWDPDRLFKFIVRKIVTLKKPGKSFYRKLNEEIDKALPQFLNKIRKENKKQDNELQQKSNPPISSPVAENIVDKKEINEKEKEPVKQNVIDEILESIDITNDNYSNEYIRNFYNKSVKPLGEINNPEQKAILLSLLKILDKYGHNPSVAGQDINYMNNVTSTFDILRTVSLAEHACDVANNIVPLYYAMREKDAYHLNNAIVNLYITALAHDIGKIPLIYKNKIEFTKESPAHPILSVEILSRIYTKFGDKLGSEKSRYILDHHKNNNERNPDELPTIALKQADAKARIDEEKRYETTHPEEAKDIKASKQQYEDRNNNENQENGKSKELLITWLDRKKDIETILNQIKKSINAPNEENKDKQVRALYIGTDIVYVMRTLISDIFLNIAEQKGKTDFIARYQSTSDKNSITLTITKIFEGRGYLSDEIESDRFDHTYYLYDNKGKLIGSNGKGYYIPIKASVFNITDKDKKRFAELKKAAVRNVKRIYKIVAQ